MSSHMHEQSAHDDHSCSDFTVLPIGVECVAHAVQASEVCEIDCR